MTLDPQPTTDEQASAGSFESQASPAAGDVLHRFVSFFLGETKYALPAHAVAEVTGYLTPTLLPDAPPAVLGIAPIRGDIVAVVEPGSCPSSPQRSKQKAIVLRPADQSVELPVAFNVDRVGEIMKIDADRIRFAKQDDSLAEFEAKVEDVTVLLIEPARIQSLLSVTEQ